MCAGVGRVVEGRGDDSSEGATPRAARDVRRRERGVCGGRGDDDGGRGGAGAAVALRLELLADGVVALRADALGLLQVETRDDDLLRRARAAHDLAAVPAVVLLTRNACRKTSVRRAMVRERAEQQTRRLMTENVVPQIMHCVAMRSGTHTGASGESCSASGAAGLACAPSTEPCGRLVWRSASRKASSQTSFSCGVSAMTVNDFSVVITWNALTSSVPQPHKDERE